MMRLLSVCLVVVPDHQRDVWCSVDGYVVDAEFVQGLSFLVGLKDEYVVWHLSGLILYCCEVESRLLIC